MSLSLSRSRALEYIMYRTCKLYARFLKTVRFDVLLLSTFARPSIRPSVCLTTFVIGTFSRGSGNKGDFFFAYDIIDTQQSFEFSV